MAPVIKHESNNIDSNKRNSKVLSHPENMLYNIPVINVFLVRGITRMCMA